MLFVVQFDLLELVDFVLHFMLVFGLYEIALNFMDFLSCFLDLRREPCFTENLFRSLVYLFLVFLHHFSDEEFAITNFTNLTSVPYF